MARLDGTKIRDLSSRPVFLQVARQILRLSIRSRMWVMRGMWPALRGLTGYSSSVKTRCAKLCIRQRKSGPKSRMTSDAAEALLGTPCSAMASATRTPRRRVSSSSIVRCKSSIWTLSGGLLPFKDCRSKEATTTGDLNGHHGIAVRPSYLHRRTESECLACCGIWNRCSVCDLCGLHCEISDSETDYSFYDCGYGNGSCSNKYDHQNSGCYHYRLGAINLLAAGIHHRQQDAYARR